MQDIFLNSKIILDIEHPNQKGLTMRTFESLGAGKKLITTNATVKEMDFYNANNIVVIDRDHPAIPMSFFKENYVKVDASTYARYSLRSWVTEIFVGQ